MQTAQNDLMVTYYVSERNGSTEVIQARKGIDWNLQITSADKFLPENRTLCDCPPKAGLCRHQSACPSSQDRRMIIPFSGNYHVPDSTDSCSSSCPSLVGPRSAKRRRTERTMRARRSGSLAESAGRLSSRLTLVVIVQ